ncbi:MAG TPA: LysM peptidoglycan-binding domain-containing protein, partial [Thermoanaerobaculia bacterium]|nr:LysM peptidoglycan-binding domain-containing protein [Thermoanaerobaculia bacterium]
RGIWQFMHETAVEYGLRVDWWIDERADPEKSARAAAAYLNDLYRDFNDWPLTLAAYNAGAGRNHRALDATGGTTFWDLVDDAAIPKETRGYVPTFYATILIATDPEAYGFRLGSADDDETKEVAVEGPLSLAYIAEVASVDRDLLRELNPSLRRGIVPPGRNAIRVPASAVETLAARASTLKNEDANIAVCSYTVRDGDSIKRLARAIGTSVETILAMNALRSVRSIGEGDSLYLPVRARELGTLLAHYDDPSVYYHVRHGDTLFSIAKKRGLTVNELRDLNDLATHAKLHSGQRIRVYRPRPVTAGN